MFKSLKAQGALGITLAAAGILMITMGARQSIGLFVGPINTSTGLTDRRFNRRIGVLTA